MFCPILFTTFVISFDNFSIFFRVPEAVAVVDDCMMFNLSKHIDLFPYDSNKREKNLDLISTLYATILRNCYPKNSFTFTGFSLGIKLAKQGETISNETFQQQRKNTI